MGVDQVKDDHSPEGASAPLEQSSDDGKSTDNDEPKPIDALLAIEFCCWTVLVLAPFLRWVNGPAVTTDQFVVQCTLVTLALLGAVSLRAYDVCQRISRKKLQSQQHNPPTDN